MNRIIVVIIIVFLMVSCKNQSDRIEQDLYKCFTASLLEDEKTKLKSIIIDFENHLVEKGILNSSEPKSYYDLYKKIADNGVYDFSNEFNFTEKISFLNRKSPEENQYLLDCHREIFQSEKYLKSKLYEFTKEMKALKRYRARPYIIASIIIKYLSEEDFELKYNRLNTLMFIEDFK